jgi:hypothetical protein
MKVSEGRLLGSGGGDRLLLPLLLLSSPARELREVSAHAGRVPLHLCTQPPELL